VVSFIEIQRAKRIVPDTSIVSEVVSSGTVRTDEAVKVREYEAAPSILRSVIVASGSLTVH
jgi:hypothetical protein